MASPRASEPGPPEEPVIGPYKYVKRLIRSMAGRRPRAEDEPPPSPPVDPVEVRKIFKIADSDEFARELGFYLAARVKFERLNASQKMVAAIWELEAEINNGGFDQYFFNSAGDYAREALEGLEAIGARTTAELLRQAMALFPEGRPSADREARWAQADAISEAAKAKWGELDGKFYDYPDRLSDLVQAFCRSRSAEFLG